MYVSFYQPQMLNRRLFQFPEQLWGHPCLDYSELGFTMFLLAVETSKWYLKQLNLYEVIFGWYSYLE